MKSRSLVQMLAASLFALGASFTMTQPLYLSVTKKMGIDQLLKNQREEILRIAALHGAYNVRVFGSVARGEARSDSDVDFLISLGENRSPWFPVRLKRDLENLLGRKVDIVTEKGLKERIREQVLKEAVLL